MNRMLDREAVAARLAGPGISYTEFSYQLLQSYDYLELYRRYDCTLQTGGSDQWGNIVAGVDLIRRVTGGTAHAMTTPLLIKADGSKFGKTESGTVWLDPALHLAVRVLPVLDQHRGRLGRDPAAHPDVPRAKRSSTLEKATTEPPHARAGQRALAQDLTTLVHGDDETVAVEQAQQALSDKANSPSYHAATLGAALREHRMSQVPAGPLPSLVDLLAATELVASKSAARRAIERVART